MSTKISATIVADSLGPNGDRITSILVTFPRFILAELNTHRMLSKNSASSRAIPFNKMIESVQNNPFIPIAWQKEHSGMQGSEYITDIEGIELCKDMWLVGRDRAVWTANNLNDLQATKQLCNRLLEPFMWHTVLITATEWENFFNLRCPQYENQFIGEDKPRVYRSKKDLCKQAGDIKIDELNTIEWLKLNKGMAEIHMMALAEAMYDAMNESKPNQLKAGEWHIPFDDKIVASNRELTKVKIATAMCARTSYTIVGDEKEFTLEQQVALHDRLLSSGHWSPYEHCAKCMSNQEYDSFIKGQLSLSSIGTDIILYEADRDTKNHLGWCNNFKGFIQYRYLLENG